MENQLTISQDPNVFLSKLNAATGYNTLLVFPMLKFNAEEGEWLEETNEKDAEGKPVYKSIGKEIKMHIITTRKMVQSEFKSKDKLFSREFQGDYLELLDENKNVVLKGFYKAIKQANPNLVWQQVLYAFVNDKPYRIKLSGSKLTKWFPYFGSFKNDNPALYLTVATCGNKVKSGGIDYYELNFTKGEKVEVETVIKRVNDINQYLSVYNQIKDTSKNEVMPEEDYSQIGHIEDNYDEEIRTEDLPF